MKPIRIILVDDHKMVRAGIHMLLNDIPEIEIVAEAGNGQEAIQVIERLHPDLVLMDIALPDVNGLIVTEQVKQTFPDIKFIILSMFANEEYVLRALQVGASGYLLKEASTIELQLAVQSVIKGDSYLSPAVSRFVIDGYSRRVNKDQVLETSQNQGAKKLTPRQREVVKLIASGFTTKEIAQKMDLSVKTIEGHRLQIMKDLDMHDIASLVRYAIRAGIIPS